MKLIREHIEDIETLVEDTGSGKNFYIEGIFMQMETPNKNKRFYPRSVVEPELDRYINETVNTNRAWGELDHPTGPKINPDRISHRITEMRVQGNDIYGKAIITRTPMGDIARGLMESGGQIGVSSRGLGGMAPHKTLKGIQEVNLFRIATAADIVTDPSAPKAYVQGIMEGAEWVYNPITGDYIMEELVERQVREFKQEKASMISEGARLKAFEDFLAGLSRFSK
jgi:hypothetical protein